jgi:hypothetical protein
MKVAGLSLRRTPWRSRLLPSIVDADEVKAPQSSAAGGISATGRRPKSLAIERREGDALISIAAHGPMHASRTGGRRYGDWMSCPSCRVHLQRRPRRLEIGWDRGA